MNYTYLGDRHTDPILRGARCTPVYNPAGKCIRGRNGNMLVFFPGRGPVVVVARLLRKVKPKPVVPVNPFA